MWWAWAGPGQAPTLSPDSCGPADLWLMAAVSSCEAPAHPPPRGFQRPIPHRVLPAHGRPAVLKSVHGTHRTPAQFWKRGLTFLKINIILKGFYFTQTCFLEKKEIAQLKLTWNPHSLRGIPVNTSFSLELGREDPKLFWGEGGGSLTDQALMRPEALWAQRSEVRLGKPAGPNGGRLRVAGPGRPG